MILILFSTLIFLIRKSIQDCTEGCLRCDKNFNCLICDAKSLYVLVNGNCIQQDLDFCLLSFNLYECAVCNANYYLEINKKCSLNPSSYNQIQNCMAQSNFTRCSICSQNTYPVDGGKSCSQISNLIEDCSLYSSNSTCAGCGDVIMNSQNICFAPQNNDDNCLLYSQGTICTRCQPGYYLENNYYINNLPEIYQYLVGKQVNYQFVFNSTGQVPQCQKGQTVNNCAKLDANFTCLQCNSGYFLNSSTFSCILNPQSNFSAYYEDIPFCYKYNRTVQLLNNIWTNIVNCQFCFEGYFVSASSKKCQPHSSTVNNCKILSQTIDSDCLLCNDAYYRGGILGQGQICLLRSANQNCLIPDYISSSCLVCVNSTYILYNNNQFCGAPISNCLQYNTTQTTLSCQYCIPNYYFNPNLQACIQIPSGFDPYCSYYGTNSQCTQCFIGYYFNSLNGKCSPNDPEYVFRSACQIFDTSAKNTCFQCTNLSTKITLGNTCKLPDLSLATKTTQDQYFYGCSRVLFDGTNYSCLSPFNYSDTANSNGNQYVLNTTDSKTYILDRNSIQFCSIYNLTYDNNIYQCLSCYSSGVQTLTIPYSCNGALGNLCLNDTNLYCYSPLDQRSPYVPKTVTQGGYTGYQHSYNNCGYYYPSNCCITRVNGYCTRWDWTSCSQPITFTANWNLILNPSKTKCVYERTGYNCYLPTIESVTCDMCKPGFYPNNNVSFQYTLDSVENSAVNYAIYSMAENCIVFDLSGTQTNNTCLRCDVNYAIGPLGNCTICNTSSNVVDEKQLSCKLFSIVNNSTQIFSADSCFKIIDATVSAPQYCLSCNSGFAKIYNYTNVNTTYGPMIIKDYEYITGKYIYKNITSHGLQGCPNQSSAFYSLLANQVYSVNCDSGQQVVDKFYCLVCKFGNAGISGLTSVNTQFVEKCSNFTTCNTSVKYIIQNPLVRNYASCHVCNNLSLLPTIYIYPLNFGTSTQINWQYHATNRNTNDCSSANSVSNCLIQLDTNGAGKICIACKPMYTPTYSATLIFVYQQITACTQITNCATSVIPNLCEQCILNYQLSNGQCILQNTLSGLNLCNVMNTNFPNICGICKDGAILINQLCVPYSVINCLYYVLDQCVQSTKPMSATQNMIIRRGNNEYLVNMPNCSPVTKQINYCNYYITQKQCGICQTNYLLNSDSTICYNPANTPNCLQFNTTSTLCSRCQPGFSLSSNNQCALSPAGGIISGCALYSEGFCEQCTDPKFTPMKVNYNTSSICLNSTITNLCEMIDMDAWRNLNVLQCLRCKKLSDFFSTNPLPLLTQYDFFSTNDYKTYKSNPSAYSAVYNKYINTRAVLNTVGYAVCKNFITIANCALQDKQTFTNTFRCLNCTSAYYLVNGICQPRTIITNCIVYNQTANACLQYVDYNPNVYIYSNFDNLVISNPPPKYTPIDQSSFGIDGCVSYNSSTVCSSCNSTTFLYDQLCVPVTLIIPNCQTYQADGICSNCAISFFLQQNKCLIIYAQNCQGLLTNTRCLRCDPTNPLLKFNGSCDKNPNVQNCDYYSTINTCKYCSVNYSNNIGVCTSTGKNNAVPNCVQNVEGGICDLCASNYYPSEDSQNCLPFPTYDKQCMTYDTTPKCIICKPGYFFKFGWCVLCTTDPNSCDICDYKNPSVCVLCKSGYFMNGYQQCIQVKGFQYRKVVLEAQNVQNYAAVGF